MAKYTSGRQRNLKIGITSYTENLTVLEVTGGANISGNIGIGSTNPTSKLWVDGDGYFTGVVTSSGFYVGGQLIGGPISGTNIVGTSLSISGISTFRNTTLIGTGTSTGTSGQVFQVTGISSGAYFGGNVGIGSTLPSSKLSIIGDAFVSGVVTANLFYGSLVGTATTATYLYYTTIAGISTTVSGGIASVTSLIVSGISTFTNGPVLIGSGTSTGTVNQLLQVTGGAYVSGFVGVGTTTPTQKLDVVGNAYVRGLLSLPQNTVGVGFGTTTAIPQYGITQVMGDNDSWTIYGESPNGANTGSLVIEVNDDNAEERIVFRNRRNYSGAVIGVTTFLEMTTSANIMQQVPLLIGTTTLTGTASQPLQVTGGAYVSGNLGIGSANPTSKLYVVGDEYITGVSTAIGGYRGQLTGVSNYTYIAGFSTVAIQAGVATISSVAGFATITAVAGFASVSTQAGVSTIASVAGFATVSTFAGVSTFANISSVAGFSTFASTSGFATVSTQSGISTSVVGGVANINTLQVTGVSTFSFGPVLVGGGTSTGTANQLLQVVGVNSGAYIGGSLGIGSTNPTSKLYVVGDEYVTGISTAIGGYRGQLTGVANYSYLAGFSSATGVAGFSTIASVAGFSTFASTSGFSTVSTQAGISTSVVGGVASVTSLNVSGVATLSNGLAVTGNVSISGNLSVGGTSVILNAATLQVKDRDIVLGITTDANNIDVSTDNTATHGGISIASTVGSPLFDMPQQAGINSNPFTYKQWMWISSSTAGAYSGVGTDAWVSNYAIGIGTLTIRNGSRLTVGAGFTFYDSYLDAQDIKAKNINATGIVTANKFYGDGSNLTGITASSIVGFTTYAISAGVATSVIGGIASVTSLSVSGISTLGTVQISSGIVTASTGIVTYYGDGSRLTGITASSIVGISSYASTAGFATVASIAGFSTYATSSGVSTSVIGGIASVTSLSVSGISTLGTVQISSGIVTAASGIVTYYGDGSKLSNIISGVSISTNTTNQSQYLTYVIGTGTTTGFGVSTTGLVFNPSTGNLGIGTITPLQKTHILGNLLVAAGSSTGQHITQKAYELNNGTLSWEGTAGQLFSITNNLTSGSIFSVNDVSGIPSIDVNADGTVSLVAYSGNVAIGSTGITGTTSQPLQVTGGAYVSGNLGIGSTRPTSKLYVVGDGYFTGVVTATAFYGSGANLTNITAGIATYATSSGVSTSVIGGIGSITQLQVSGVSTFSNGPVLVGTISSTGTASQPLQVTGGAYVSGSVGIGTTTPIYQLDVVGSGGKAGTATTYTIFGADTGRNVEIGIGATNIPTFLDFHGADLTYSDYATRLIRSGGDNSDFNIINRGTGALRLITQDAGTIDILTQNIFRHRIDSNGVILIGAATSTGTASQPLQVTGGAYVSGSVGIGTTNPSAVLDVRGNPWFSPNITGSKATALRLGRFIDGANAAYDIITDDVGGDDIEIQSNRFAGNLKFSRSSTLGIQTTFTLNSNYLSGTSISIADTTGTITKIRLDEAGNTFFNNTGAVLVGTISSTGTASQLLQVNSSGYVSGNLGIGRTNPSSKLEVLGTIAAYSADITSVGSFAISNAGLLDITSFKSTGGTLRFVTANTSGTNLDRGRVDSSGNFIIGATSATGTASQPLQVTGGAYVSGSVGMGTTNPTSKLWVDGDGYFTGILTANRIVSSVYGEFTGGSISGTNIVGTALSISGISTFSGIATHAAPLFGTQASFTGVVTAAAFYGSGANLTNIPAGSPSISTVTSSSTYYPTFVSGTSTTGFGITSANLSFIPSTGNLGLGATTPSFKADIAGDARVQSTGKMRFGGTAGTTNFYIQYNSTANSLDFVAG